ncbi:hypothetical protein MDAP_000738 [Mitosporidium daphniae]
MNTFDLVEQLLFYKRYHTNKWNKVIHFIFIPAIFFSSLVLYQCFTEFVLGMYSPAVAFLPVVVYSVYYILLEPVAGITITPILATLWYGSRLTIQSFPAYSLHIGACVCAIGWIFQILGHWFFEDRKYPALSENIIQALALAPLFVYLEFLFKVGYRPLLQSKISTATKEQ